jgi:4-hydroxy-tetrahydrodipicolinate synthase
VKANLQGIIPALVTPFSEDRASVDYAALGKLIDFVVSSGVDGLLTLGGTGEYLALSDAERKQVIEFTVRETDDRVPVFTSILSPGLGDSIGMAEFAKSANVSGLMVVTPYYATPGQDGILRYYSTIVERARLPIILYNIPSRTGVNLRVETIQRLVEEFDMIIGIKECNRDITHVAELLRTMGTKISVLCGEDDLVLPELILGARGAILASANLVPGHWQKIYAAMHAGDMESARDSFGRLLPLIKALFVETNPGPLKEAMKLSNLPVGPCRYPLMPISQPTREGLIRELQNLGVFGQTSPSLVASTTA